MYFDIDFATLNTCERSTKFDPDSSDRVPLPELVERTKSYLYHRFPNLKGLPIAETRVCQYENSLDGNFIMNYHKKNENVLVLSGSSGHGFKLGPGLGELVKNILIFLLIFTLIYHKRKSSLM